MPEGAAYVASDTFGGALPGYVFGTGRLGTGYYREGASTLPAAGGDASEAPGSISAGVSVIQPRLHKP